MKKNLKTSVGVLATLLALSLTHMASAVIADNYYLTGITATADPGYKVTTSTASNHLVFNVSLTNLTTVQSRLPQNLVVPGEGCDLSTAGVWNLANYGNLTMDVLNNGPEPVLVQAFVSDNVSPAWVAINGAAMINPGETKSLDIALLRSLDNIPALLTSCGYYSNLFVTMNGLPGEVRTGWNALDLTGVKHIALNFPEPYAGLAVKVTNIRADHEARLLTDTTNLLREEVPLFDKYGQHTSTLGLTWPKKVTQDSDLPAQLADELAVDLADNPPLRWNSRGWNTFGGWALGPWNSDDVTGSFHTKKSNGRWWLVDPWGNLFWSFGLNGVGNGGGLYDYSWARRSLFAWTPPAGDPLTNQIFFDSNSLDFAKMNAYRKFGTNWDTAWLDLTVDRMWSWRMNTLGGWPDRRIGPNTGANPIPYTVYIQPAGNSTTTLDGGTWALWSDKLPDVFNPSFVTALNNAMTAETNTYASHTDPMCLGYFILNEVPFGDGLTAIAAEAFKAPANAIGKGAMVSLFKTRYGGNITNLNNAWQTSFSNWTAVSNCLVMPAGITNPSNGDLQAFSDLYITNFYKTCSNSVKQAASNKLYLGSRINAFNHPNLINIAARYCDVLSFNLYQSSIGNCRLPAGVDKPVLISEFQFGTIGDRGSLGVALKNTRDVAMSARLFENYATSGLMHSNIVGVHWYSYRSFGDMGFVDVADVPRPQLIKAARDIGTTMYAKRNGNLIYEERFPGGWESLAGTIPAVGTNAWVGDANIFNANGTIIIGGTNLDRCAYLPFTPVTNKVYKASVRIIGFEAGDTNRLGVGFLQGATVTKTPSNARAALTFLRASGYIEASSAPASPASYNWLGSYDAPANISVILDTRPALWEIQYQLNDASWQTNTFTVNPAINAVGITRDYGAGGGTFDNFVLETLPNWP